MLKLIKLEHKRKELLNFNYTTLYDAIIITTLELSQYQNFSKLFNLNMNFNFSRILFCFNIFSFSPWSLSAAPSAYNLYKCLKGEAQVWILKNSTLQSFIITFTLLIWAYCFLLRLWNFHKFLCYYIVRRYWFALGASLIVYTTLVTAVCVPFFVENRLIQNQRN